MAIIEGAWPRLIKSWTRYATARWNNEARCASCETPVAGFPYRRHVYAVMRVVRGKTVSRELEIHFYCDKIGCARNE